MMTTTTMQKKEEEEEDNSIIRVVKMLKYVKPVVMNAATTSPVSHHAA